MILKVWEIKSGQKNVTIPRGSHIKAGDYVVVRRANEWDMMNKIDRKVYWQCDTCKNTGCSGLIPTICPYCNRKKFTIISDNQEGKE